MTDDPVQLVERLGELAAVDPDALVDGLAGEEREAVLRAHRADLEDALRRAQALIDDARRQLRRAGEPLAWVGGPGGAPDQDGEGAQVAVASLEALARGGRELASVAEASARVLPRLVAVARRSPALR